jgi:DNA-binding protein H-NS
MPPERSSYADIIRDLKQLKAAFEQHAELLGDIPEKKVFDTKLQKLEELRAQSDSLKTERQSITAELFNAVLDVREDAMRLRAAAKLKLGPRSELLVQFGIAPLRLRLQKPRSRKKKEEPTPPPPVETATEAAKKREAA